MTEPMKIQLALQGGGAKIVSLMAVMETVQDLEKEGLMKVCRIAGTSAGSLIGCLFAAGISMSELRAELIAGKGKALVGLFPSPKWHHLARLPLSGRPFWNSGRLASALREKFGKRNMRKLEDLTIEVLVVSANLSTTTKNVHKPTDDIVSSIMDSCGIPYFFRTWDKQGGLGNVIVDGGICENLPISELKKTQDEPIVAIAFRRTDKGVPNNVISFTQAILETAMNNSIERARKEIEPDAIHEVVTKIDTFDFDVGMSYGLADDNVYGFAKINARNFFCDFVEKKRQEKEANAAALQRMEQEALAKREQTVALAKEQQQVGGDFWADQSPTTAHLMRQLGKVYEVQHSKVKFKYSKCIFAVQANCLLQDGEQYFGSPDWFSYRLTFQPVDEPIHCVSVGLSPTPEAKFSGKTRWTVRDAENRPMESIDVAIRNPDQPDARELLLFFNPVLQPGSGTYSLLFRDEAMLLMPKLVRREQDELEFYPRRAMGTVDRIDLLLHIPERLKNSIYMEPQSTTQPGRPMTEGEIDDYNVPPGFHTLGWTGINVTADDQFGVNFRFR